MTVTFTEPAACGGVTAVIWLELTTFTEVPATPPKVTVAPDCKFLPLMVTLVPPEALPEVGEMLEMLGGGPVTFMLKFVEVDFDVESVTWVWKL